MIVVHKAGGMIDPSGVQTSIMKLLAASRTPVTQNQISDHIRQELGVHYIEHLERLQNQGAIVHPEGNPTVFMMTPEGKEWCYQEGIKVRGYVNKDDDLKVEIAHEPVATSEESAPQPRKRGRPRKNP